MSFKSKFKTYETPYEKTYEKPWYDKILKNTIIHKQPLFILPLQLREVAEVKGNKEYTNKGNTNKDNTNKDNTPDLYNLFYKARYRFSLMLYNITPTAPWILRNIYHDGYFNIPNIKQDMNYILNDTVKSDNNIFTNYFLYIAPDDLHSECYKLYMKKKSNPIIIKECNAYADDNAMAFCLAWFTFINVLNNTSKKLYFHEPETLIDVLQSIGFIPKLQHRLYSVDVNISYEYHITC